MTEWDEDALGPANRRVPGRYVVYILIAFGVLLLGFMVLLALKLDPAAERFHNPPAATKR